MRWAGALPNNALYDTGAELSRLKDLHARGILVRYFETPQLFDALRITVGTNDEVDQLLRELRSMTAS